MSLLVGCGIKKFQLENYLRSTEAGFEQIFRGIENRGDAPP